MKTKKLFFVIAFLAMLLGSKMTTAQVNLPAWLDTMTTIGAPYRFSVNDVDSITLHKPFFAQTNMIWGIPGIGTVYAVDSITIGAANSGNITFVADEPGTYRDFYIYIDTASPVHKVHGSTYHICTGPVTVWLNNVEDVETFLWSSDGGSAGGSDHVFTLPGVYWIDLVNAYGTTRDSFIVDQPANTLPNIGIDTTFCNAGVDLDLAVDTTYTTILWSTSETTSEIHVSTPGTYSVTVANACISGTSNSIVVQQNIFDQPDLGSDIVTCFGDTISLTPSTTQTYSTYGWSNSSNASSLSITDDGTFTVTVTEGTCVAVSNTVDVSFHHVYQDQEFCVVTVDPVLNKNIAIWEKPVDPSIASFNVYKEITTNNFSVIGSVPYASTATFTDMSSNPPAFSSTYKISVVDTCGNESDLSSAHTTIQLGLSQGIPNSTMVLDWTDYIGVPVDQYYIYRGHTTSSMTLYDSIPGSQSAYNDLNVTSTKYYQIGVSVPGGCNPGGTKTIYSGSFSNQVDNDGLVGISNSPYDIDIAIFPNPSTGQFQVKCEGIKNIVITDIVGKVILTTNQYTFDLSSYGAGTYFATITTPAGSAVQKLVVTQ